MTRLHLSRRSLSTLLVALAAMLLAAVPAEAKVRVGLTTKATATGVVATVKVAGAGKSPVRVTLQRKASGRWIALASATAKRGKARLAWASTLTPGQALRVRVIATRGKRTLGTSSSAVARVAKLGPTPAPASTPAPKPQPKPGNVPIDGLGGGSGPGDGTGMPDTPLKVATALDPPHLRVAVGGQQACAVNGAYEVRCWPSNARFDETYAAKGVGVTGVGSVGVGTSHACAFTVRGVYCWGSNAAGQVGTDNATSVVLVNSPMAGTATATSMVVGGDLTCVNFQSSPPACWGTSYVKPGSLTTPMTTKPSTIGLGLEWKIDTITPTEICARTHAKGTCFGLDGEETPYSSEIDPELRKYASGENSSCRTRVSAVICSGSAPTSPVPSDFISGSAAIPNAAGLDEIATNGETYCGVAAGGLAAKCWGAPAQGGATVWTALALKGFND
jgi:hypothetical protein